MERLEESFGRRVLMFFVLATAAALLTPPSAHAASAPVFSTEVPAGHGTTAALRPAYDPPRRVDGSISDWHGKPARFGGSTLYSSGELVYQDHIFDAYGPDNGQDVQRLSIQDPLQQKVPEIYRLDPAVQYLPGEFGIPTPGYNLATHYGDLEHQDQADLSELRIGAGRSNLWFLARTTTMTAPVPTALLVLLDTAAGATTHDVPFGSGIKTSRAEYALLLTARGAWVADLRTGSITALPRGSAAANPTGYVNALEARVPRSALGGLPARLNVTAATGIADPSGKPALKDLGLGANLANIAFRQNEPARDWWDKQQAFSLYARTIDPFFHALDLGRLLHGANQRYVPGPGYHDRIFRSTKKISKEEGQQGTLQHYGIYLPTGYRADRRWPLQWWFHFRGGNAHIAAAAVPRIFKDMGEDVHSMVVTPDGRGTSTWYVGRGQVDFREVWNDVQRSFAVDPARTYIAGHSMGGWASYLLTILYPDRFAASFPASGPVTQGAWTGVDFANCDEYQSPDGETPCYTGANDGDPRAEFTRPLLDNERWVPLAIYQGVPDELVPTTGVVRQAQRLGELGYRYRLYLFPAQEHYGPPITDQWTDGARYEHQFTRPLNPASVTYIRSMPFERAVERIQSGGAALNFDFDDAYWMFELVPVDMTKGVARFNGQSLAIRNQPYSLFPEVGGPATPDQTGPYAMAGQKWAFKSPWLFVRRNAFSITLRGASAVGLDVARMGLSRTKPITGQVDTDHALKLRLRAGRWSVAATLDGRRVALHRNSRAVIVPIPAGRHTLVLRPAG